MVNRLARIAGPALLLIVAFVALLASLAYGGGAAAPLIADPGAAVRYGLPVSKLLVNLGAAGTIGPLLLACFAFAPQRPEYGRALDIAAGSAALWTVASAATGFFVFL
ncbi:MAG TPA: copper transporter, partial [Glaciihabitans sp.]|nr:copper transporter [Glaciihabitans sp.]